MNSQEAEVADDESKVSNDLGAVDNDEESNKEELE